jgi:activator of 2-hydroxyglutaryl-CoA dehydratase
MENQQLLVGIDIGSTTVKATVVDGETQEIIWSDYQRHQTKQPETVLDFLERIEQAVGGLDPESCRMFLTGSGAGPLVDVVGSRFVQEVNAVTMAVEALHPDVGSVVELGAKTPKSSFSRWTPRRATVRRSPR